VAGSKLGDLKMFRLFLASVAFLLMVQWSAASIQVNPPESKILHKIDLAKLKLPQYCPIHVEKSYEMKLNVAGVKEATLDFHYITDESDDEPGLYTYTYTYTVTNNNKHTVAFCCELFDKLTGAEEMMIILEPGNSREVTLESKSRGVYRTVGVEIWIMVEKDDWKKDMKKMGAKIDGHFFYPVRGRIEVPLPFSSVK
jgi:hypothetical protein